MSQLLRCGEVVYTGPFDECVEYAKMWGLLEWVDMFQTWLWVGDSAIV